jgi:biopolymer transport protein ExbB/TolQ
MKLGFSGAIEETIFHLAAWLQVPVIVLALLALAAVIIESGAFAIEVWQHRRRSLATLTKLAHAARDELRTATPDSVAAILRDAAWTPAMGDTLDAFATTAAGPAAETLMPKLLADFDFGRQRRLSRTRFLVRVGPALGLMGTLIPLSPALEGLAQGDVTTLADNLRVAFSITVLGLLIGAIAFGLSLVRDRLYGQDYSDLEYVAAILTEDTP